MDYLADPDIDSIVEIDVLRIPAELGLAETGRLELFLRRDLVLEGCYLRDKTPSEGELQASADAAMAVYDECSTLLSPGWKKFAVLQAGLAGVDLDSSEIMEWAYGICKDSAGWLGDFEIEQDREMPLLT